MKNNWKRILIINIIILAIIAAIVEIYFYIDFQKNRIGTYIPYIYTRKDIYKSLGSASFPPARFKEYNQKYNKKSPILMLGCSYTYGYLLNEDQSPAEKLHKLTNRWIYNWGTIGLGPMISYLYLKDEEKEHTITEPPEYIIFTYMFNHIDRYCYWRFYNTYRKEGFIKQRFYPILDNTYTFNHFHNVEFDKYMWNDPDFSKKEELLLTTIKKIKLKTDKLFPKSKFIFLIYSDVNKDLCNELLDKNASKEEKEHMQKSFDYMHSDRLKENLKNMGIEVITTEELIGRKMDREDDRIPSTIDKNHPHPSEKAWDEIIPALIKRLNL